MSEPQGVNEFRRAILIDRVDSRTTRAEVEDNFHHFSAAITHDGGVVTDVSSETVRHPWSLCPAAATQLQRLVGTLLNPCLADVLGYLQVRDQCTHLYDMACLAMVHAARQTAHRRIDMTVSRPPTTPRLASLSIDGLPAIEWKIEGDRIVEPHQVSLKRGFVEWTRRTLDPENGEQAILLRRAVFVSGGLRRNLDDAKTAADGARNIGGCFVMRHGTAEKATRMFGSTRYFDESSSPLD